MNEQEPLKPKFPPPKPGEQPVPRPISPEDVKSRQQDEAWQSQEVSPATKHAQTEAAWHEHDLLEHQEQLEGKLAEAHFAAHAAANQNRELTTEAKLDKLTGLANRESFENWLGEHIAASTSDLWVGFLDLDKFKEINDKYGHSKGDEVLRWVAKLLSTQIREHQDIAAHPHGDEFLLGVAGASQARIHEIAEAVIETINSVGLARDGRLVPVLGRGANEDITPIEISIGFAKHQPGVEATELLKQADTAMYNAKQAGRNRYEIAGL